MAYAGADMSLRSQLDNVTRNLKYAAMHLKSNHLSEDEALDIAIDSLQYLHRVIKNRRGSITIVGQKSKHFLMKQS
jgi:hypothetical protein